MSRFDLRLGVMIAAAVLLPASVAQSQCPGEGDCCEVNPTPGCDDAVCCEAVCDIYAFCCDVEWDSTCVNQAMFMCVVCSTGGACCLPGFECIELTADACAGFGGTYYGDGTTCDGVPCGGGGDTDCCVDNGTPGCDDPECEATVCAIDPFCCDTAWDGICAGEAIDLCAVCAGPPPVGACCFGADCLETDAADCAAGGGIYEGDGTSCGAADCWLPDCSGGGDCCAANGTAGCDDAECCEEICIADPFCCDVEWDQICADAALDLCAVCSLPCPDTNGDLVVDASDLSNVIADWGGSGPSDVNLDGVVDVQDLVLVITNWGPCAPCGDVAAGSCCEANGSPYCDDTVCCNAVCEVDPFCCDVEWDQLCADAALDLCAVCGGSRAR